MTCVRRIAAIWMPALDHVGRSDPGETRHSLSECSSRVRATGGGVTSMYVLPGNRPGEGTSRIHLSDWASRAESRASLAGLVLWH